MNSPQATADQAATLVRRKLFAVVVTFNRLAMLRQTVASSLAEPLDGLVIVNNASTDGTAEWLQQLQDERVQVLHLPANVGGAGGFHHGFQHVLEKTDADWLVCYDDDAYPQRGSIAAFMAMELPSQVAGVAAAVYLPNGQISEMNRPSRHPFASLKATLRTTLKRRAGFHVSDAEYVGEKAEAIDFSSFVGCFLRVSAVRNRLGLPRKELFIYADDIMYTHSIGVHGLLHWFAPQVRFTHDCGTLVAQQSVYKPLWKAYYTYRNGLELYRQIAGPLAFPLIAILKLISWVVKARHYDHPGMYLRLLALAWRDGMLRQFGREHAEILRRSTP